MANPAWASFYMNRFQRGLAITGQADLGKGTGTYCSLQRKGFMFGCKKGLDTVCDMYFILAAPMAFHPATHKPALQWWLKQEKKEQK